MSVKLHGLTRAASAKGHGALTMRNSCMPRKKQDSYVDAGRLESEKFEPDAETKEEFAEAAHIGGNQGELIEKMLEESANSHRARGTHSETAWKEEGGSEEVVGGANPTPDQDVVE